MQRGRGGYTIIEVMLVLAISGTLLIAAILLFKGKQGGTQFSQAMHDIDSKIQSYVNDIGTSLFPNAEQYQCTVAGGGGNRPVLQPAGATPQTTGSNQDCIFLGKAIQLTTGSTSFSTYTILGNRADSSLTPVTTFDKSNPEPAADATGLVQDLIEHYDIPFGAAQLQWSRVDYSSQPAQLDVTPGHDNDLIGFYNSLQPSGPGAEQGAQTLLIKGYQITDPDELKIRGCIEGADPTCLPKDVQGWYMCFTSQASPDKALFVVNSTPAGITTKLYFNEVPAGVAWTCS